VKDHILTIYITEFVSYNAPKHLAQEDCQVGKCHISENVT